MFLPDLLIIGAPKCGTTTLYHLLRQRSGFFAPDIKEPNFFEFDANYQRGLTSYARLFEREGASAAPTAMGFEATPWYLYSENAARRIERDIGSHVRFIICVRDPIDRAMSMYRDLAGGGREQLPFRHALEAELRTVERHGPMFEGRLTSYLSGGFYHRAAQPWIARFGRDAVRFVDLGTISASPEVAIADLLAWFGFPSDPSPSAELPPAATNPASAIRRPALDAAVRYFARTGMAQCVRSQISWELYARLGRMWRSATRDRAAAVEMSDADRAWLRHEAAELFRDDVEGLRSLGVSEVVRWPSYSG